MAPVPLMRSAMLDRATPSFSTTADIWSRPCTQIRQRDRLLCWREVEKIAELLLKMAILAGDSDIAVNADCFFSALTYQLPTSAHEAG